MIRLTVSQIVKLHEQLIQQTGGSYGIRDMGLLESAVEAPCQSFGEHELYPSIQAKAARLGYGLSDILPPPREAGASCSTVATH